MCSKSDFCSVNPPVFARSLWQVTQYLSTSAFCVVAEADAAAGCCGGAGRAAMAVADRAAAINPGARVDTPRSFTFVAKTYEFYHAMRRQ